MTQAPGKSLLKVVGIILIVGGALGAILSLLMLAGGGVALGALSQGGAGDPDAAMGALVGGLLIALGVVGIIGGIINLVAGILGVKNANIPEKAGICVVMGVIMLIIQAITIVLTLMSGDVDGSTILSVAAGLVLPVLYMMGAMKNKNAAL